MMLTLPRRIAAVLLLASSFAMSATGQPVPAAPAPADTAAAAAPAAAETLIAAGDSLRVTVFQSPDLTLETRVEENGTISYPLIGSVPVAGLTLGAAERRIAQMLRDGGFLVAPHVTVTMLQVRGSQVTVLGQVLKPGRYPLDGSDSTVTDVLALAGGVAPTGADVVVLTGTRAGKPIRREIDVLNLGAQGTAGEEQRLQAGDMLFVNRAPTFYIYGEVQKPGAYRLERGMILMQALALSGGLTPKGTQRGLTVHRRGSDGTVMVLDIKLDDPLLADDIIYVRESLF